MYTAAQERDFFQRSKEIVSTDFLEVTTDKAEAVIRDIRDALIFHEWKYYVQNAPVLSDFEYDQLFKKLQALEARFPEYISPDSPTQRVSNDLTSGFATVEHLTPMLSLDNSYNANDLQEWDAALKRLALMAEKNDIEYVVEPKFDGGSVALVYENDQLVRAATRGNGIMGDEMTANARTIRSVPLRAAFSKYKIARAELRGEVLIRKDVFKKINEAREKEGLPVFANPRNAATGGLRMKDPKESALRQMVAFLYQLGYAVDAQGNNIIDQFDTHDGSIEMLNQLGFKVPVEERKVCKNIQEAIAFCAEWEAKRENYRYEIDGMVVKVNSRVLQERVGYTSHHPRWAMAYKFKAKQATSTLETVEYQVGKIGSITPVAKITPVHLAGVTVSSISLHNEDFITGKDLRLGDTVLVERAGDVIPYIVKAMEDLRDGSEIPVVFPKYCPVNTTQQPVPLVREAGEAAWRCPQCVCGQQPLQRMIWHVSKAAMDIDGLGERQVQQFYERGWVRNFPDLYRLPYEEIEQLEGFGEKSVTNLRQAINKAKKNPIHRLLHSLSIHHLGKKVSKLIAAEINHVLDLQAWTIDDFTHIKDVGPKVADNIMEWFAQAENVQLLKEMEALGVNLTQTEADRPKQLTKDGVFSGKSILFTGKLTQLSRKEAQTRAEAAGARNVSAVSSKLDILVVGEKAGSKLKKAQALGTVRIMTEAEFVTATSA